MNRAVAISWHRYVPHHGNGYRVLFEYWLKQLPLWANEFDHLYLIDSDMEFTEEDYERIKKNVKKLTLLKRVVDGHHWYQFKWLIPQIKEDNILFLDNDVVISKSGVIDGWFKSAENGSDFVGSFDSSGGLQELIREKYPVMKVLGNRMGSYYFILTKKLLKKIGDYTFEPNYFEPGTVIPELDNYVAQKDDWLDSFGWFTLKILKTQPTITQIKDPRDSIYLQPVGEAWDILKEPSEPTNLGYYHIRNGNLANYVLSAKSGGWENDYQREINGNKRELLRSLAWFYIMDDKLEFWFSIKEILYDMGVSEELWDDYIYQFAAYHEI